MMTMTRTLRPPRPACVCGAGHGAGVEAGAVMVGAATTMSRCVELPCSTKSPRTALSRVSTESTTWRGTTAAACVMPAGLRCVTPAQPTPSAVLLM